MLKAWAGDLDGMKDRRVVRILVPYSKTIYFIDKGEELGTAVELGEALSEWLNKGKAKEIDRIRIGFVPTPRDKLLTALNDGLGDVAAGNLTITPNRLQIVDFARRRCAMSARYSPPAPRRRKLRESRISPARRSMSGRPAVTTSTLLH